MLSDPTVTHDQAPNHGVAVTLPLSTMPAAATETSLLSGPWRPAAVPDSEVLFLNAPGWAEALLTPSRGLCRDSFRFPRLVHGADADIPVVRSDRDLHGYAAAGSIAPSPG